MQYFNRRWLDRLKSLFWDFVMRSYLDTFGSLIDCPLTWVQYVTSSLVERLGHQRVTWKDKMKTNMKWLWCVSIVWKMMLSQEQVSVEIWKKYLASWLGGRIPRTWRVSEILPPTNNYKPDISFRSLHEHCCWLYLIPFIVFRLI